MSQQQKTFISNKEMPNEVYTSQIKGLRRATKPLTIVLVFMPLAIFLIYDALIVKELSALYFGFYFFTAPLIWSIIEYIGHKYGLHADAESETMKTVLYTLHHGHHDYPADKRLLFTPFEVSIPTFFILYGLAYVLFGTACTPALMAGIVVCYVIYEWLHYAVHCECYGNPLFKKLKHHHLMHHFQDADKNFGFTTTTWDEWLETSIRQEQVEEIDL